MLQIMRAGRWEYDRAERELVAAFNAVRKVKTPGGFITYETDRARGSATATLRGQPCLLSLTNQLAAKEKTSVSWLWSSDEQKK
ncbi:putative large terminase subunit [Escherichia coli]|nr:putative large terminase subunit [Escherichia coli]